MPAAGADDALVDTLVGFLRRIGLVVREAPVPGDAFLPGVQVEAGEIVFDRTRLRWPGDLLHEAGHIAVTASADRHRLPALLEGHPIDAPGGEIEATAWAYAACVHLGLAPTVLFHDGGYHGRSASLALTYSMGVYPGCQGLVAAGLAATGEQARALGVAPYPHLLRWLRE